MIQQLLRQNSKKVTDYFVFVAQAFGLPCPASVPVIRSREDYSDESGLEAPRYPTHSNM
jgi:hypothetical protein